MPAPNISYVRNEVTRMLYKWRVVRDCLEGEEAIKKKTTIYLPKPNPTDKSPENKKRYEAYVERASFYPVTSSTMEGLLGQVFDVDPVIELPNDMDYMKTDATGSNVSLSQVAMKSLGEVLGFGRSGLLADYPTMDTVSRLDVQLGIARPVLVPFNPDEIINWRTVNKGAKTVLTLVVLSEMYVTKDDGFELETGPQWRELRCDEDTGWKYRVRLWISDGNSFIIRSEYWPKDANGNVLDFIPFTFIGAMNNDTSPDAPPLYGIASLNVKHYRNSADYEDSVYMVGQPTPVCTGMKKAWIDEVMKGKLELGSRGGVFLPEGGAFELAQVQPNTMCKEAMDQKEAQMVALGAQLIQPQNVSRTLGEAKMDKNSQTSVLAKCAKNTSAAITMALGWCALFDSGEIPDPNEVYIQLSTTFAISKMSPQEQAQVIANWQGGALTWNEMRAQLRMAGIATEDDDAAKEEIAADAAAASALALDTVNELPPNDPNNPNANDNPQNQ
jgi:hypothetical protein